MTQEEKQLLLKDLSGRLPYGVIVDYKENEFEIPHWKITTIYPNTFDGWIGYDRRVGAGSETGSRPFKIGEVKPYLRPMSSMTEEEKEVVCSMNMISDTELNDRLNYQRMYAQNYTIETFDYFNEHHLDFRGLIPMGLALEAPEGMYKTK